MRISFNIETMPPVGSAPSPAMVKVPANYKDPEKILEFQVKNQTKAWQAMAVDPFAAQVFCIGFAVEDDEPTVAMLNNELDLLTAFQAMLPTFYSRAAGEPLQWITFNGVKFDFALMWLRGVKYGLRDLVGQMRPRNPRYPDELHVDTFVALGGEGKLDEWINFFGIQVDNPITGDQVSESVLRRQYDLIQRHTISRVIAAREIHAKLKSSGVLF